MSDSLVAMVPLGTTYNMPVLVKNPASNDTPANGDADPTYRAYDYDVASYGMAGGSGTCSKRHNGTVSGAANNGSGAIRITTPSAHNLTTGQMVTLASVGGVANANGTFRVTVITSTTFDLDGSTFAGAYTSGGVWNVTGFYYAALVCTAANGFGREKIYPVQVNYEIGGVDHTDLYYIQIV